MVSLEKAAEIIVKKCLGVKSSESVLVITDKEKLKIGKAIFSKAGDVCKEAELVDVPIPDVHGTEPPEEVARFMKEHDVVICPTTKSLTHTKARKNACENGSRVATLPEISEEILERAIDIDYNEMVKLNNALKKILDCAKTVCIKTENGTDLKLDISNRKCKPDNGIITEKGESGNLPGGEVFLAPLEGKASGVYVVDGSHAGVGKLDKPIKITVKDGYAVEISGGKEADKLKETLDSVGDKDAFNIAELGIGTNPKAKLIGQPLEDEKVKGTCHIALGNNFGFGGKINVALHVDGIILDPTVIIDDAIILEKGKFLI